MHCLYFMLSRCHLFCSSALTGGEGQPPPEGRDVITPYKMFFVETFLIFILVTGNKIRQFHSSTLLLLPQLTSQHSHPLPLHSFSFFFFASSFPISFCPMSLLYYPTSLSYLSLPFSASLSSTPSSSLFVPFFPTSVSFVSLHFNILTSTFIFREIILHFTHW